MKKIIIICLSMIFLFIGILILSQVENKENLSNKEESSRLESTVNENVIPTVSPTKNSNASPAFVIKSPEVNVGTEEVAVDIFIKDNVGVSSIGLTVNYDSKLKLKEIVYNHKINGQTVQPEFYDNPITLLWVNAFEEIDEDFVLATLYFDTTGNSPGEFPISLYYNEDYVYNYEQNNIKFNVVNGKIKIY